MNNAVYPKALYENYKQTMSIYLAYLYLVYLIENMQLLK